MNPENQIQPGDYARLLSQVKARVLAAQYAALKAVNQELMSGK